MSPFEWTMVGLSSTALLFVFINRSPLGMLAAVWNAIPSSIPGTVLPPRQDEKSDQRLPLLQDLIAVRNKLKPESQTKLNEIAAEILAMEPKSP